MNQTETEVLYLFCGLGWGIAFVQFCWLVKSAV